MEFNRVKDFDPSMIDKLVVGDNAFVASVIEQVIDEYIFYTVSDYGTVVAYALFGRCRGVRHMAYMISAYIVPGYRERDIDTRLMMYVVKDLKQDGYSCIYTLYNETSQFSTALFKKIKIIRERNVHQLIYTNKNIVNSPLWSKLPNEGDILKDVKSYNELSAREKASLAELKKNHGSYILGDDNEWEYSRYFVKYDKVYSYIPIVKSDHNCIMNTGFALETDPRIVNILPIMLVSVLKKLQNEMNGDTSLIMNYTIPQNVEACRKALGEPDEEIDFSCFSLHL